jgi:2,4-dienoyl-CoA reductase-like NADH-dependent reductase (Old Yellow Enzyme family)
MSLFTPVTLRAASAASPAIVSRNRVWLAPLTNMQSQPDGTCSDLERRFLGMRSDGGFGLVETCAAHVTQDGKAWPGEMGVHDDAMTPGLTTLVERIHEGGALASAQLFHGGLRASTEVSGLPILSASAVKDGDAPVPVEATEDDLARIIEAFASAARRCASAGFDSVELHGAHGYLLSQFLSTYYNQRTDRWGGSLENRARLIREVARAVRAAAPSLVLACRISPEDFGQTKGVDLDESIQVAQSLIEDGVEVLHLSLWRAGLNTTKRPEEHATNLFREAVGDRARIVVAGGIWTREEAEAQIDRGADFVALGRGAIANHDWPQRIEKGEAIARPPVSAEHLEAQGLSPGFVGYMGKWKGFVS